ncbi:MAG TPA: hypothetical protein VMW69_02965 [Spirochaetia bacterium]|nr:hypothetical protein [Spirochaetia bacterium]
MAHPVSNFIVSYFYWVFLAILVVNLMQRRYREKAQRKRFASLYIAILVFVLYIYAFGVIRLNVSELFLLIYAAAAGLLLWSYRKTFLPFSFRCRSCKKPLTFDRFAYADSNLCAECQEKADSIDRPETSGDSDTE